MCRSMADIRSTAAEIRRGKKRKKKEGKKLQGKNIMAPLLHRAAITNHSMKIYMVSLFHRATIKKEVNGGSQINKQAMCVVPKSTNESSAHYDPNPLWAQFM